MNRISEEAASAYLEVHYGEIKEQIHHLAVHKNFAGVFQAIVNFLQFLLEKGQVNKVGIRMQVIGKLHEKGNDYLKYIIENLFIRSFKGIKRRCTMEEWSLLYRQIPVNLKCVYLQQIK